MTPNKNKTNGTAHVKNQAKFLGETDSEVAAHLISLAGPKAFAKTVDFAGVFLALNKDGHLWVIKSSGELSIHQINKKSFLLASELDFQKYEQLEHRKNRKSYVYRKK